MTFLEYVKEWINGNPGKAAGAFIGFILGIFILSIGFVKTLLIIIFILIGFIIGKLRDDKVSVIDQIKGIFNRNR